MRKGVITGSETVFSPFLTLLRILLKIKDFDHVELRCTSFYDPSAGICGAYPYSKNGRIGEGLAAHCET